MKGLNYIRKAIDFATIKHFGQKRKGSGLDYVTHPIKVGFMLQSLNMPYAVIIAGILHDVLEDTDATYDELVIEFGIEVAALVLELTSDTKKIRAIQKAIENSLTFDELILEFDIELSKLIIKLTKDVKDIRGIGKNIYLIDKMINMTKNALCAKFGDRLDNVSDQPPVKYLDSTLIMLEEIKIGREILSIESQELMGMIDMVCSKEIRQAKEKENNE